MINVEKKSETAILVKFKGNDDDIYEEMVAFLEKVSNDDRLDALFVKALQSHDRPALAINVSGNEELKKALLDVAEALEEVLETTEVKRKEKMA